MVSPVTVASVLCANRTPHTPSVDLSFPAATTSDFGYVATTVPLIAHDTLSPFTETAISWVTGWPGPAAFLTAGFAAGGRPPIWNGAGPKPRRMKVPLPYVAQYR